MVATKSHALPLWLKMVVAVTLTSRHWVIAHLMAAERWSSIKQLLCSCTSTHPKWLTGLPPRLNLLLLLLVQLAVVSCISSDIIVVSICLLVALLFFLFHVTETFVCQWLFDINASCITSSDRLSIERNDVVFEASLSISLRHRSWRVEEKLLWIDDFVITTDGGWLMILMLWQMVVKPFGTRLRTAATAVRRPASGSLNFLSSLLPAWSLN